MKTVTFFSTLMRLARELADAERSGDKERIAEASRKHEEYRQACLRSDLMIIPQVRGS